MAEYYSSTMTDNETHTYVSGDYLRCFLDPNGAHRTWQPTGIYSTGYEMSIINVGNYGITFDPAVLSEVVGAGQKRRFYYDGAYWR